MKKLLTLLRSGRQEMERARLERALVDVQLQHLPTYAEMRASLEAELRRARRYERPLVIVVAALDEHTAGDHAAARAGVHRPKADSAAVDRPLEAQMRFMLLGAILQSTIRECDIIACGPDLQRFVIAFPECGSAAVQLAIRRLAEVVEQRMGAPLRAAAAVYPGDGLTLEDLVASANAALGGKSTLRSLLVMREQAG